MKKANIILVNPSCSYDDKVNEQIVYPNTAMMLFVTILDKEGYEVRLIDGNRYETPDCIKNISNSVNDSTLFVGFSVMTSQVAWAYKMTKEVKRLFPHLCIVWGGVHPTLYPEQAISDNAIDIVTVNEACSTIVLLAKAIEDKDDLSKVPGIYFKSDNEIIKTADYIPDNIKNIPYINFSLFDVDSYLCGNLLTLTFGNNIEGRELLSIPVLTGLGCAYKCTFCINVLLKRQYRFRSAEEIVDRVEYLQKTYNANFFQFLDEDFFISKKRTFDFIDLVEKRNLKFYFRPWACVSHFRDDYISLDVAKRLERIGMVIAVMGAECGSQTMLDRIQKQIKVEDTVRAVEILSKTKIIPRLSMMVGLPGEKKKEILDTYRLAVKLKGIDKRAEIPILSFALYPGSPIFNQAVKEYGFKVPSNFSEWTNVNFAGYLGFYLAQDKPWIFNREVFDRMNYLYNMSFQFETKKGKVFKFFYSVLIKIIKFRFTIGWFSFPFEDYLFKLYRVSKASVKNTLAPIFNKI